MADTRLACTVRGCGRALERAERTFTCANGHAYDVARSGYINLLQPQDRRSTEAGDAKDLVTARSRLFAAHVGRAIVDAVVTASVGAVVGAIVEQVDALNLPAMPLVVDLGSGSGDVLDAISRAGGIAGIGIDLSAAAADHAARRYPALTWVVANADRRLPLLDGSTALVLSLHGRRNPAECSRILAPGGFLLVAVPAHDDLIELRASVQGLGVERDRTEALIAEHEPFLTLVSRQTARERRRVEGDVLRDLLRTTYRGARQRAAPLVEALDAMEVTLASELVLFRRRP